MKKVIATTVVAGGFLFAPMAHAETVAEDTTNQTSVDNVVDNEAHVFWVTPWKDPRLKAAKEGETAVNSATDNQLMSWAQARSMQKKNINDAFGDNQQSVIDTSDHAGSQFDDAFNQFLDTHADNDFYTVKANGKKQFTKEEVDATWNDIKKQIMDRANSQQSANVGADDNEFIRR